MQQRSPHSLVVHTLKWYVLQVTWSIPAGMSPLASRPGHMITTYTCWDELVPYPHPTHEGRGSGYTSPISWASGSAEAL